jgi:hypothetical protein
MMKHVRIYLLPLFLLLAACHETEQAPEASTIVISELIAETEQMPTSKAGEKEEFGAGDKIHVFGFADKSSPSSTRGTRFMPDVNYLATSGVGLTYTYFDESYNRGSRFRRTPLPGDPDPEVGFWRVGEYHDFTAYYFAGLKPTAEEQLFAMGTTGLPREELLWGETMNLLYRGDAVIRPEIKFKHQLSRIRVELIHNMNDDVAEDFTITGLEVGLNKEQAKFNFVEGEWTGYSGTTILTESLNKNLKDDIEPLVVTPLTDEDWWVLPGCDIELTLHYKRFENGAFVDYSPVVPFENNITGESPTTRKGYITVLRLHINDVKPIIFTVSLEDWNVEKHSGEGNEIVIDDDNEIKD